MHPGIAVISYELIGCPACGGELYRSRRQGIFERYIFALLQMRAYRCHRCRSRFLCLPTFIFRKSDVEEEEEKKRRKRKSDEAQYSSDPASAGVEPKGTPTAQ